MASRISSQGAAFLIVLAGLGIALSSLGLVLRDREPIWSAFSLSLGGSCLAVSLSITFIRVFEPSKLGELINLVAEVNRSSILSADEKRYVSFRKRFHGYLRSRSDDGHDVWRYRIFDFGASVIPGQLHAVVDVPRSVGGTRKFIYDGYICGDHLILIGQPMQVGSESHVIHIFPDAMTSLQRPAISGFCFVDSYDGRSLVTPTILSEEPLTSENEPGTVSESEADTLKVKWRSLLGDKRQLNFDPNAFNTINH